MFRFLMLFSFAAFDSPFLGKGLLIDEKPKKGPFSKINIQIFGIHLVLLFWRKNIVAKDEEGPPLCSFRKASIGGTVISRPFSFSTLRLHPLVSRIRGNGSFH